MISRKLEHLFDPVNKFHHKNKLTRKTTPTSQNHTVWITWSGVRANEFCVCIAKLYPWSTPFVPKKDKMRHIIDVQIRCTDVSYRSTRLIFFLWREYLTIWQLKYQPIFLSKKRKRNTKPIYL